MAELTFKINGAEYPIPNVAEFVNSLTIDECGIFHDWTGTLIEDIEDAPVNSLMIAAFMQIAYQRGNPGITQQDARKAVGASNFASAVEKFNAAAEADASPPAQTPSDSAPNASPGNKNASAASSGDGSTTPSVIPIREHNPSGSPLSALSVTSGSPR